MEKSGISHVNEMKSTKTENILKKKIIINLQKCLTIKRIANGKRTKYVAVKILKKSSRTESTGKIKKDETK
jgi:hypothetical protein